MTEDIEGLSKGMMLAVPLKRGSNLDLVGPLTNWVNSTYESLDIDASFAIEELNKERQVVAKLTDLSVDGLLVSANYYDVVAMLLSTILRFGTVPCVLCIYYIG